MKVGLFRPVFGEVELGAVDGLGEAYPVFRVVEFCEGLPGGPDGEVGGDPEGVEVAFATAMCLDELGGGLEFGRFRGGWVFVLLGVGAGEGVLYFVRL